MIRLFIQAKNEGEDAVVVKLEGTSQINPQTGQVTTTFSENPQLPFSELKLELNGGPRAPLANPQTCGRVTTTSVLEPWSALESGASATPFSSFDVSGCAGATPFAPTLTAGTSSNQAGSFSPVTTLIERKDGEQTLKSVSVTLPKGVAGIIANVPQCDEAEANAGTCSPASQIGYATTEAGPGPDPVTLPQSGEPQDPVYLTGPYDGAPFGLSIVVHPEAGPFNLGTVVVRARIEINPQTAQVTVKSDPIPTILDGIPLQVKQIYVDIDRPDFMFNGTNCDPLAVNATITGYEGAVANVSDRFQVANCASLAFKPSFTASTPGKATFNGNGAGLTVKIVPPGEGPQSSDPEANLKETGVLPGWRPCSGPVFRRCSAMAAENHPKHTLACSRILAPITQSQPTEAHRARRREAGSAQALRRHRDRPPKMENEARPQSIEVSEIDLVWSRYWSPLSI